MPRQGALKLLEISRTEAAHANYMASFNAHKDKVVRSDATPAFPQYVVTATDNGYIQVINLEASSFRLALPMVENTPVEIPLRCLAISPALTFVCKGEPAIVFGLGTSNSLVWSTLKKGDTFEIGTFKSRIGALFCDGDYICCGDNAGSVVLWRSRDVCPSGMQSRSDTLKHYQDHLTQMTSPAYQAELERKYLVEGGERSADELWHSDGNPPFALWNKNAGRANVVSLCVARDVVLACFGDFSTLVLNVADGTLMASLSSECSTCVAITPYGAPFREIAVCSQSGTIAVWSPQNEPSQWIPIEVHSAFRLKCASLHNQFLALGSTDGRVALYAATEPRDLRLISCFDIEKPVIGAFITDDNYFLVLTAAGDVWRWPLKDILGSTSPKQEGHLREQGEKKSETPLPTRSATHSAPPAAALNTNHQETAPEPDRSPPTPSSRKQDSHSPYSAATTSGHGNSSSSSPKDRFGSTLGRNDPRLSAGSAAAGGPNNNNNMSVGGEVSVSIELQAHSSVDMTRDRQGTEKFDEEKENERDAISAARRELHEEIDELAAVPHTRYRPPHSPPSRVNPPYQNTARPPYSIPPQSEPQEENNEERNKHTIHPSSIGKEYAAVEQQDQEEFVPAPFQFSASSSEISERHYEEKDKPQDEKEEDRDKSEAGEGAHRTKKNESSTHVADQPHEEIPDDEVIIHMDEEDEDHAIPTPPAEPDMVTTTSVPTTTCDGDVMTKGSVSYMPSSVGRVGSTVEHSTYSVELMSRPWQIDPANAVVHMNIGPHHRGQHNSTSRSPEAQRWERGGEGGLTATGHNNSSSGSASRFSSGMVLKEGKRMDPRAARAALDRAGQAEHRQKTSTSLVPTQGFEHDLSAPRDNTSMMLRYERQTSKDEKFNPKEYQKEHESEVQVLALRHGVKPIKYGLHEKVFSDMPASESSARSPLTQASEAEANRKNLDASARSNNGSPRIRSANATPRISSPSQLHQEESRMMIGEQSSGALVNPTCPPPPPPQQQQQPSADRARSPNSSNNNYFSAENNNKEDEFLPATAKNFVRKVDPKYMQQRNCPGPKIRNHSCEELLIPTQSASTSSTFFTEYRTRPSSGSPLILPLPMPAQCFTF